MEAYQDNLETHDLEEDLSGAVALLVQHAEYVTKELWIRLQGIGRRFETNQGAKGGEYGADFSMAGELAAQGIPVDVQPKLLSRGLLRLGSSAGVGPVMLDR